MSTVKNILRTVFRRGYYAVYGRNGKHVTINGESYTASAHIARGIQSTIDETPLKILIGLAKDADILFDVGANVGIISLILSKKMKPGSHIYSFEPAPGTFVFLKDTARVQQGNATVHALNNAIGSRNEVLQFSDLERTTRNHIVTEKKPGTIPVQAISIDSFCKEKNVIPNVMKVDIEGAEYWALMGMQQTLRNNNITVLIEIHPEYLKSAGITSAMFEAYVNSIGYKVFNTSGIEIPPIEILQNTLVILARDKPAASVSMGHS